MDRAVGLGDARCPGAKHLAVVAGYGPLQQYVDDPTVEEVWTTEPRLR